MQFVQLPLRLCLIYAGTDVVKNLVKVIKETLDGFGKKLGEFSTFDNQIAKHKTL